MDVKVFDTHVRTTDGRHLHFDVLTEARDQPRAARIALDWLAARGVQDADISQAECLFCHAEPANPAVAEAIRAHGYFIIPLQGFQEV
ncbi:hypothetical protein D9M68_381230 [compost metagenome]